MKSVLFVFLLALAVAPASAASLADEYLDRYFAFYPAHATSAGRHDLDTKLEDLSPERRRDWVDFNRKTAETLRKRLADPKLDREERMDDELLLRQARLEVLDFATAKRPERDPLFWTGLLGDATVFLLVRDDMPLDQRLERAAARAQLIPRLARQAREALAATPPGEISAEITGHAAGQAHASAVLYRESFPLAAKRSPEALRKRVGESGAKAAAALDELGAFLDALAKKVTGSPRLGKDYPERFRLVTGVDQPVDTVLANAEADLAAKRTEAAAFGRSVWAQIFAGEEAPKDDRELLHRLFAQIAVDRAHSTEEFLDDYRHLTAQALDFVREKKIVTLPDPITIQIDRSPAFFLGQSVGGVYAPGPYAPDANTLYFLPTPPDDATPEQRDAFFRDFNHHFNVMITSHEIVPGHYVQLKIAAHHPHKARVLFADGVSVEGWGTFCERLMLDLGWGGPLDRLAHLKKQMENIARTIVDIRVHTRGMSRDEVLRYVKEDALQDDQFARNMWARSITTAPQITFYYLGYQQIRELYDDVKKARGNAFNLRTFMDGMMEMGPVPVARYRERMLPVAASAAAR
jgi:uncharacterized protein (DUF885 family)